MPFTNAQKQARWRERHVVVLSAPAQDIASKLIATGDLYKLHTIAALINGHLKDHPCPRCGGTGTHQVYTSPRCDAGNRKRRAKEEPPTIYKLHPCPACRPAEYFVACGGQLRNEGRYVEAIQAALEIHDLWSVGDTMLAWGVTPKEAQGALDKAGNVRTIQRDLAWVRDRAQNTPPDERTLSMAY